MADGLNRHLAPIMPRRRRVYPDGLAFHVINRGNRRGRIFLESADYETFLDAMAAAAARTGMRVLAFCLMPNHWHLVLWPRTCRELSAFMQRLMNRHIRVHQKRHGTSGTGHIYQGRFKSVAIEDERQLLRVCRYVAANPLRAGLVDKAEEWPWSDLSRRTTEDGISLLSDWPIPRPADWLEMVNRPQSEKTVEPIRSAIVRARLLVSVAKDGNS
jgi:putative transposase